MKIYTIKQKESGTGNIHDLASNQYDRYIKFPEGHKFAVVLAAYYGGKGYTTHRTVDDAIKKSRLKKDYTHQIIDSYGNMYHEDFDSNLHRE